MMRAVQEIQHVTQKPGGYAQTPGSFSRGESRSEGSPSSARLRSEYVGGVLINKNSVLSLKSRRYKIEIYR